MITMFVASQLLPERLFCTCFPVAVLECVIVVFGFVWRSETKEMPKLHYRAFRRIERMAPEKWEPAGYDSTGTVQYHESTYMHGSYTRIAMKTYPEALLCHILYAKQYEKRKQQQVINQIMENCVVQWKDDIDAYKAKAEAQAREAMEENMRIQIRCSN